MVEVYTIPNGLASEQIANAMTIAAPYLPGSWVDAFEKHCVSFQEGKQRPALFYDDELLANSQARPSGYGFVLLFNVQFRSFEVLQFR